MRALSISVVPGGASCAVAPLTGSTAHDHGRPVDDRTNPVARADNGLLAQVEDGAPDSSTSLADTLRKGISLGCQAGSEELRDWARRELDGYKVEDQLPVYWVLPAAVKIDGTTSTRSSPANSFRPSTSLTSRAIRSPMACR